MKTQKPERGAKVKAVRQALKAHKDKLNASPAEIMETLKGQGLTVSQALIQKVKQKLRDGKAEKKNDPERVKRKYTKRTPTVAAPTILPFTVETIGEMQTLVTKHGSADKLIEQLKEFEALVTKYGSVENLTSLLKTHQSLVSTLVPAPAKAPVAKAA